MNSDRMTCGNHILPGSSSTGQASSCFTVPVTFRNNGPSGIMRQKRGPGAMPFSGRTYRGDNSGRGLKAAPPFCWYAVGDQPGFQDFPHGRYLPLPEGTVYGALTGRRQTFSRLLKGPWIVYALRYRCRERPLPGAGAS